MRALLDDLLLEFKIFRSATTGKSPNKNGKRTLLIRLIKKMMIY
jgi:hypothetical protein